MEQLEIIYSKDRWNLFKQLRIEAAKMMLPLENNHIIAFAYGSIARGDVSEESDIDVFIPNPPSSTIIEVILENSGANLVMREIVQATPTYAAKGYVYVGERRSYSFPLVSLKPLELEFYGFAGSVDYPQILEGARVPGVDKRLRLIQPNEKGHMESSVQGREGVVAKILGISVPIVLNRVKTLIRREKVGRTGTFISRSLAPEESFGEVFKVLTRREPAIRRRLRN